MASRITVPTPARRPYRGGLMSVAEVLDSTDPHFGQGVQFDQDSCAMPKLAPGDCWATYEEADPDKVAEGISSGTGVSFTLYSAVECFIGPDDDFAERAEAQLLGGESYAVEALLNAEVFTAVTEDLATAANLQAAIGAAEQWLGSNYPGLGIIHADRTQTTNATALGIVERGVDFPLETKQGTPWANSAGLGADDGTAPISPSAIYASGLITVWRGPVHVNRADDLPLNTTLAIAERHYSMAIDCAIARVPITA